MNQTDKYNVVHLLVKKSIYFFYVDQRTNAGVETTGDGVGVEILRPTVAKKRPYTQ